MNDLHDTKSSKRTNINIGQKINDSTTQRVVKKYPSAKDTKNKRFPKNTLQSK